MSDMRRLRDETRNPFARALLESAHGERSDNGACDRALGALGIGTVGVGIVATTTAAKAATAVVSGAGIGAAKGGTLYLVKWIGIGILGTAAVIGSASYVQRHVRAEAPRTIAKTQTSLGPTSVGASHASGASGASSPAPRTMTPLGASARPEMRSTPRSSPVVESAAAPIPHKPIASAASMDIQLPNVAIDSSLASAPESVTAQLSALSAVRATLAAHDPEGALAKLSAIEGRNPSSPFAEEIAVLRIDALSDAGRIAEASALAQTFATRYPSSAYGEHVHSKTNVP